METRRIVIIGSGSLAETAARSLDARFVVQQASGEDRAALRAALKDCYGVFAAGADLKLVAMVAASDVEHFIVACDCVPVEEYTRCLGVPSTFVRNMSSGAVVADMFDRPEEFIGRTVEIAF
jgi:hypothetical protein